MAHFILEYSSNLNPDELDLNGLFGKLHQAALDTKLFPLAGIRSRAHRCEHFRVADGDTAHGFVHLHVKLGTGRTDAEKKAAADSFFDVLGLHLNPIYEQQGMAISFEMNELPSILKYNKNNLRNYLPA
jgi:5-carboxymethyl-2-hydroxymuconate isomerase